MTPVAARGPERPFPRLIVITELARLGAADTLARFEQLARAAPPGTVMAQLRDKERPARERLELGRQLSEVRRRHRQLLQVNDRLDLAVLLSADAVHLGEASVDLNEARRVVGDGVLITRACHDLARVAELDADGLVLSPVLAERKGSPALGVEALRKARGRLDDAGRGRVRLVALGGVDGSSAAACFEAGADGVAVVGAWLDGAGAEGLLEWLGKARD
jgi:thiamine-phosphate pyrophosphorylase